MAPSPPDSLVRLSAHAQGLRDIYESGRLSPTESSLILEALDIIQLMIERPDFSHSLMSELAARELYRRNRTTSQQAAVIWTRVVSTLREAVETSREIGRVSPEMQSAIKELTLTLEKNMVDFSQPVPLIQSMDKVELASQQLRTQTRLARLKFYGKPHPSHDQGALLTDLAVSWKPPTSPQAFLEGATLVQQVWEKVSNPSPRYSPGRG